MENHKAKIKIIYILSASRSGSTLLNLILGSARNAFSVGELVRLKYYYNENLPWIPRNKDFLCDCGVKLRDCKIWSGIDKEVDLEKTNDYFYSFFEKIKSLILVFFPFFGRKFYGSNDYKLFKFIIDRAKREKGEAVEYIIDSSKNLRRLQYLKNIPELDVYAIHLVRDIRGVANSREDKGTFWLRSFIEWLFLNTFMSIYLRLNFKKSNYLRMSYDLFSQDHEKYLELIKSKFKIYLDTQNIISEMNTEQFHNFSGNRMRWNKVDKIQYDSRWKKMMPRWKKVVLSIIGYLPNKLWVYSRGLVGDKKNDFKVDFIGIGAAKCATSWIYKCLVEHPNICGPYKKELNFFISNGGLFDKKIENKNLIYNRGLGYYKKYFSHCSPNSLKGEYSVSYMVDVNSPDMIKKDFPNVKIIACLRDPIKRAYSAFWYGQKYKLKDENISFRDGIKIRPDVYIERGMYYKQLKRYFELFPRENILVLFTDDLKKDPLKFMQGIYKFLGADENFVPPSINKKENAAKKTKSVLVKKLINSVSPISNTLRKMKLYFIVDLLRAIGIEDVIVYVNNKLNVEPFKKPPMSSEDELYLRNIYREDIERLEVLLGKDLVAWKE